MTFPLPPTKLGSTMPSQLAQQDRRISRGEGLELPTPRTYRANIPGYIDITGATGKKVISLDIFLQPGEIVGVMGQLSYRVNTPGYNHYASFYLNNNPFGTITNLMNQTGPLLADDTKYTSFVSHAVGYPGASIGYPTIGDFPGAFIWLMPYRDSTSQVVSGPSASTAVTLDFYTRRDGGSTSPLYYADAYVWAMIL